MRAVIQRVSQASVTVDEDTVGRIDRGLLVLLGVGEGDDTDDARYVARKVAGLRIFEDEDGRMNLSVRDVGGQVLLVPQFTLYGDCRRGRRPSFSSAAAPDAADALYGQVAEGLESEGVPVSTGQFQAHMQVALVNDGPVTILLDSGKDF
jgi:D-tyrosyl-tRNA(Tyr) deacylase